MDKEDIIKRALKRLGRILCLSLLLVAAIAVFCIIYGLIADGYITVANIFTVNYAVGVLIIGGSIVVHFLPSRQTERLKRDKLIDITAYKEAKMEERGRKRWKGSDVLYIGIAALFITAVLELLVWLITTG